VKTVCCAVDERHVENVELWIHVIIPTFVIERTIGPNDLLERSYTVLNEKTLSEVGIN
jgi:hypothetical protein